MKRVVESGIAGSRVPHPSKAAIATGRLINRPKPWRRIATRSEKRAANDEAMLTIVFMLLWR